MQHTPAGLRLATAAGSTLDQIVRDGARAMLQHAIEREVAEYVERHKDLRDGRGHRLVVRNGHHPPRRIRTGVGGLEVRQPRVNDRRVDEQGQRVRFTSAILPPYLRNARSVEQLVPWLYLKGVSTNDFPEALAALGHDGAGLSAANVGRMKEAWRREWQDWSKRDLAGKRYVYIWADGVYFNVRLKARGLEHAPELATGDGAMGFWSALAKVYPRTRRQRCWVHKTANVLAALPETQQNTAKRMLQDVWMAATRDQAESALDAFAGQFRVKYPKATGKVLDDRGDLLAFYDFPAEHWQHLRTTNPIESTFATVRLRTAKTKGSGSRQACLTMVFQLARAAERRWRKLNGTSELLEVAAGVEFENGIRKVAA